MATLPVIQVSTAGAVATLQAAAAGGDQFSNNQKTALVVDNAGASPITVTIAAQVACNRGVLHPTTVAVNAGQRKSIGPFDVGYTDGNGMVQVSYSGVTSVTVGAQSL